MDNIRANGNLSSNNNSEMDEFHNCIDKKIWLDETVDSRGFINEKPCDAEYNEANIHTYISIKDENIDDLTILVPKNELVTDSDYTEDKVGLNETVISGGDIKQEPCVMKDEHGSTQIYLSMKDENVNDLTVITQQTEVMTDCIDNKVCVYETIISRGYIKEVPCNMGDGSGGIHNNINMKGCEECGEEYDLYCLKCPMLVRIFDSNIPDGRDNTVRWTLPKNFVDIYETPSGLGIIAIRTIPKGVVCGPFKGLDRIKDNAVSKWKLRNKELIYTKDSRWLNWMQYIRIADQDSHQNLVPFQYEGELYYRSDRHINVGNELLVQWDRGSKESEIEDMEDSYWEPRVCESLDDSYACTFCCVGYKSISHLKAHNFTCIEKRNRKDFCGDIVQCDICKIYLDKKEYSDYHMDRCYKSNEKCVFNSRYKRNHGRPLRYRIRNGDRPFSCTLCQYKAKTKSNLKQHIATHNNDRPFACTLCTHKATKKWHLKQHIAIHNGDKPFACTLCPYKTTRKSILKRHIAIHNGVKPFACSLCPYKAVTNCKLKLHIAFHNGDKPYECTLCPYKASTNSNLKKHIAIHNDDKPFGCVLCPYKTTTKSILKRHIAIHNGDKPFACTLCTYKTTTRLILKQHIAVHNNDRPFACTLCKHKATTNSNLKKHIATHNADRRFACTLCPYKTTTKSILKHHVAVHNDDRPFACTLCPYKATTNWKLKQHVAVHNGDKPFACSLCPYRTTTKSVLKRHVAVHNGDKPFACTLCPYKASTNSNLKKHIAIHNGDKPFACSVCPYKTRTSSNLKKHIAIHNGDKPFACTLCPYKTTTSSNLKQHVASHNK